MRGRLSSAGRFSPVRSIFPVGFRNHMVVKGRNRDTWPPIRAGYDAWLAPENFRPDVGQKRSLER